jgi:hypothetical protein
MKYRITKNGNDEYFIERKVLFSWGRVGGVYDNYRYYSLRGAQEALKELLGSRKFTVVWEGEVK